MQQHQLLVSTPANKTLVLEVAEDETIGSIKSRVADRTGIPLACLWLATAARPLVHDTATVAEEGLRGHSTVQANVRLLGGAFSAHKDAKLMEELHETEDALEAKAKQLAGWVREARHCVVFTGAGISTAAGIPDFRGPNGVWTKMAKHEAMAPSVAFTKAVPTATHMAIVELMRRGQVKHLISQNVDGMHRKSGVPLDGFSELHGNTNLEVCARCRREYLRDFEVSGAVQHYTGRRCTVAGCDGRLRDNIINFGESLPPQALQSGFAAGEAADLHIVLGSSLTVRPACDMPRETARRGGRLVIVNLQRTPQDQLAALRVHASCDDFVRRLCRHLEVEIPPFVLRRHVVCWRPDEATACAGAVDADGTPATLFKTVAARVGNGLLAGLREQTLKGDPARAKCAADSGVRFRLNFFGHYGEPPLDVELPAGQGKVGLDLAFDTSRPQDGWRVTPNPGLNPPDLTAATAASRATGPDNREIDEVTSAIEANLPDTSGWHAVTPLEHCEHCPTVVGSGGGLDQLEVDPAAPCRECGNVGENMLCLHCREVHCGRHVQGHMLRHHEQTGHAMVLGFVDLSFWCYPCESYLNPQNPCLFPVYAAIHAAKFGVLPPSLHGGKLPTILPGRTPAPAESAATPSQPATRQPAAMETDDNKQGGDESESEEEEMAAPDTTGWHAVTPLADCPHCQPPDVAGLRDGALAVDAAARCADCGNSGENMLCLQCHAVHCGRHVQGHMLRHHEQTGHAMVLGFVDLSFWCYPCESYIDSANPRLYPVYAAMHTAKFGRPPRTWGAPRARVVATTA